MTAHCDRCDYAHHTTSYRVVLPEPQGPRILDRGLTTAQEACRIRDLYQTIPQFKGCVAQSVLWCPGEAGDWVLPGTIVAVEDLP